MPVYGPIVIIPPQLPLVSAKTIVLPGNNFYFHLQGFGERAKLAMQTAGYIIAAKPSYSSDDESCTVGVVASARVAGRKKNGSINISALFRCRITRLEKIGERPEEESFTLAQWQKIEDIPINESVWLGQNLERTVNELKKTVQENQRLLEEIGQLFVPPEPDLSINHLKSSEALNNPSRETISQNLDKAAAIFDSSLRNAVEHALARLGVQITAVGLPFTAFLKNRDGDLFKFLEEPSVLSRLNLILSVIKDDNEFLKKARAEVETLMQMAKGKTMNGRGEPNPLQKIYDEKKDKMSEEARKIAEEELARLSRTPPHASEYQVTEKYIEYLLRVPWGEYTQDTTEPARVREILNEDHWGLDEPKERIEEIIAAKAFNPKKKEPILCFIGPPGVGKTSMGKSIARALNRKFERMSVGGIDDERLIRGFQRTYVGALPGKIIEALIRAGTYNPVIMIDEVDKLKNVHGDPASALLEALDPEQNFSFTDNYIATGVDLSRVLFITTANFEEDIPEPLLDRMEIIYFPGYGEDEKIHIAEKFIIPKKLKEFGLDAESEMLRQKNLWPFVIKFSQESLLEIISERTEEAGVRELERKIDAIFRKIVRSAAETGQKVWEVTQDNLSIYLGKKSTEKHKLRQNLPIGVVPMLAVTPVGGVILYVETVYRKKDVDHRKIKITGVNPHNQNLGRMIEEQVDAAWDFLFKEGKDSGILAELGIPEKIYLHVRFANGGIAKDGTSAGVAILWALYSLFTEQRIKDGLTTTGEVTMAIGETYPVGGIKEKILAAAHAGAEKVIIPKTNEDDIDDIPDKVKEKIKIIPVESMLDALKIAFPNCPILEEYLNRTQSSG